MPEPYFRPEPLERFLPRNVPPGMHYAFVVNYPTMMSGDHVEHFEEAVSWCEENLTEQYPCESARWSADRRFFYRLFIRHETDAAAFKIRWC